MEPVSGFMSFDGKFFSSPEACRTYEERVTHLSGLSDRAKAVVESCKSGSFSSLPGPLRKHLESISDRDFESLWNDHLMHLFVDEDGPVFEKRFPAILYEVIPSGGPRESDEWDFFELKAETAYRLLAFVLEKPD